ncbi:MAG: hypothetical protein LBC86_10175 [Oscillospiraceae bacterium]|nr:hypothetical protein [Oscillospiraceae bacterium]
MEKLEFMRIFVIILIIILSCSCTRSPEPEIETTISCLADLILESAEFPAMITLTEPSDIEALLPDINFNEIEEIVLIQQALSVHLTEVILIKPASPEVMSVLLERQKILKEQLAFYPAQVLSAEASVIGTFHNIAYLICHEDAEKISRPLA